MTGGDESGGAFPDGAIVLAGGRGRRLGGVDKAALVVGSSSLLDRVLAAVGDRPIVVVSPPRSVPAGVVRIQEDPPGGGPAAGAAAGLAALLPLLDAPEPGPVRGAPGTSLLDAPATERAPGDPATRLAGGALIAVLAVDQPGVTATTLARLAGAVPGDRRAGAVLVSDGRRQYTAGVFPAGVLAAAVAGRDSWHGVALHALIDPLVGVDVPAEGVEALDVDTPEDLERWRGAPS